MLVVYLRLTACIALLLCLSLIYQVGTWQNRVAVRIPHQFVRLFLVTELHVYIFSLIISLRSRFSSTYGKALAFNSV